MMYDMSQRDAEKRGEARGVAIGEARGEARGVAIGETKGTNKMAKLTLLLVKEGKLDELLRVSTDEAFRAAKMKEYGIE